MTLARLSTSRLGSEDECRAHLERLRWPEGVRCPRCGAGTGVSRIGRRGQFDCNVCRYQFSVRTRTALHGSNLPLRTWLLAIYVIDDCADVPASRLEHLLGVSYKTAWSLKRRIRTAIEDQAPELRGILEARER
jgi:transposase-like protein